MNRAITEAKIANGSVTTKKLAKNERSQGFFFFDGAGKTLPALTFTPVAGGRIVGVVGLSIIWADLTEVRSLAVDENRRGQGIGRKLVEWCVDEARRLRIRKLMSLTYEQRFFEKLGFIVVDKDTLPLKVWSDCVRCPKRDGCDEIAMVLTLHDVPVPEGLPIDDPVLDPVFEAMGRLKMPLAIHTGDPKAFFEPMGPDNERMEELADLIVVADNPLDDIHNLRRLWLVIKSGQVVVDRQEAWAGTKAKPVDLGAVEAWIRAAGKEYGAELVFEPAAVVRHAVHSRHLGRALRDSGVPREEVFVTTKVWNDHQTRDELGVSQRDRHRDRRARSSLNRSRAVAGPLSACPRRRGPMRPRSRGGGPPRTPRWHQMSRPTGSRSGRC